MLVCEISDSTGDLTAMFYGRSRMPGLLRGSKVRFSGPAGIKNGAQVMINPAYELIVPGTERKPSGEDDPPGGERREPVRPRRAIRDAPDGAREVRA